MSKRAIWAFGPIFSIFVYSIAFAQGVSSQFPSHQQNPLSKYAVLNINSVSSWVRADGYSSRSPNDVKGTTFPRGKVGVVYVDGFVWGGKAYLDTDHTQAAPFNQIMRIGGSSYRSGSLEGRIIGEGADAMRLQEIP